VFLLFKARTDFIYFNLVLISDFAGRKEGRKEGRFYS